MNVFGSPNVRHRSHSAQENTNNLFLRKAGTNVSQGIQRKALGDRAVNEKTTNFNSTNKSLKKVQPIEPEQLPALDAGDFCSKLNDSGFFDEHLLEDLKPIKPELSSFIKILQEYKEYVLPEIIAPTIEEDVVIPALEEPQLNEDLTDMDVSIPLPTLHFNEDDEFGEY